MRSPSGNEILTLSKKNSESVVVEGGFSANQQKRNQRLWFVVIEIKKCYGRVVLYGRRGGIEIF